MCLHLLQAPTYCGGCALYLASYELHFLSSAVFSRLGPNGLLMSQCAELPVFKGKTPDVVSNTHVNGGVEVDATESP